MSIPGQDAGSGHSTQMRVPVRSGGRKPEIGIKLRNLVERGRRKLGKRKVVVEAVSNFEFPLRLLQREGGMRAEMKGFSNVGFGKETLAPERSPI